MPTKKAKKKRKKKESWEREYLKAYLQTLYPKTDMEECDDATLSRMCDDRLRRALLVGKQYEELRQRYHELELERDEERRDLRQRLEHVLRGVDVDCGQPLTHLNEDELLTKVEREISILKKTVRALQLRLR